METIGTRIRREREAQGLSRKDLERQTGIGYSTLAELERGGMQSSTKLHVIAEALGVSVNWLETGKGAKAARPSHSTGLDVGKLADLLGTVEAAVEEAGVRLPARVRARLVATLYADKEASAAASAQAVRAALIGILATMETTDDEPTSAR